MLLPPSAWPPKLQKQFRFLDKSYKKLVERGLENGMMRMMPRRKIAKVHGRTMVAGGFAVPKSAEEDRLIVPLSVNELIDPLKMPRPVFAYLPALRTTVVPRGRRLLISKRDARHYYHSLRLGKAWRPWLALPAPGEKDDEAHDFPVVTTAPMGFGPSAGFAQGVTDLATKDMDERARLRYGVVAPPSLPIWGSIIDDMWVLECEEAGREPCGPTWLSRATARWGALGAEVNDMKTVDAETDQEIQGYWVDGRDS